MKICWGRLLLFTVIPGALIGLTMQYLTARPLLYAVPLCVAWGWFSQSRFQVFRARTPWDSR